MSSRRHGLQRVRDICMWLPEVEERLSHGAPTWFVRGKRAFLTFWVDGHHDLDFPHLWCAAAPGVQEGLSAADPERYFRPPYVGVRGWIGVRMDGAVDWDAVDHLCVSAWRAVAPATLERQLGAEALAGAAGDYIEGV